MNNILCFPMSTQARSVADELTSLILEECIASAIETHGIDAFSMAFTAFGEIEQSLNKLAA